MTTTTKVVIGVIVAATLIGIVIYVMAYNSAGREAISARAANSNTPTVS